MEASPASSPLENGLGFAGALVVLILAAWFARRRHRLDPEPPSRSVRIVHSALSFAVGIMVVLVIDAMFDPSASRRMIPQMLIGALAFLLISLVLFGIADFWLGLFRPCRNRGWLVGALLVFGVSIAGLLATALWFGNALDAWLPPQTIQVAGMAAASGLIWWSYLPPPRRNVAAMFE